MPLQVQNTLLPQQQNILTQGGNLISSLLSGSPGYNPFIPMSPQATGDWWNQYMRPQAEAQFQQKTMPQVRESFVGPGTYWGGARAQAEADARSSFENQQSQLIGNYFNQQRDIANQALLPFALGLLNANTGIAYGQQQQSAGGMGGFGELLRQLMQRQLQPEPQFAGPLGPMLDMSQPQQPYTGDPNIPFADLVGYRYEDYFPSYFPSNFGTIDDASLGNMFLQPPQSTYIEEPTPSDEFSFADFGW